MITNINISQDTSGQLDIQMMFSDPLEQINLESSEVCDDNNLFNNLIKISIMYTMSIMSIYHVSYCN